MLQMALQFLEAAYGHGQQEPSKGETAPAPPRSAPSQLGAGKLGHRQALPAWCLSSPICKMGLCTGGS